MLSSVEALVVFQISLTRLTTLRENSSWGVGGREGELLYKSDRVGRRTFDEYRFKKMFGVVPPWVLKSKITPAKIILLFCRVDCREKNDWK